mmetsp:Transcript_73443/g.190751  ORF Transcript_73443/g.190751 Transcript_73443/m.190751 type:complete len:266 (+) Transcript_73443:317-1114(+)
MLLITISISHSVEPLSGLPPLLNVLDPPIKPIAIDRPPDLRVHERVRVLRLNRQTLNILLHPLDSLHQRRRPRTDAVHLLLLGVELPSHLATRELCRHLPHAIKYRLPFTLHHRQHLVDRAVQTIACILHSTRTSLSMLGTRTRRADLRHQHVEFPFHGELPASGYESFRTISVPMSRAPALPAPGIVRKSRAATGVHIRLLRRLVMLLVRMLEHVHLPHKNGVALVVAPTLLLLSILLLAQGLAFLLGTQHSASGRTTRVPAVC